eukprot:TRINITY_DN6366_c0_g1_i2.p1 TRINITY_DN6366_c0_g1~~TRINITY_DN6366_c0_g1_i2.p1  ORF type:complete len:110 (-),score=26.74 TRINITY_DN6366_c0_g1_i2:124-453(-)
MDSNCESFGNQHFTDLIEDVRYADIHHIFSLFRSILSLFGEGKVHCWLENNWKFRKEFGEGSNFFFGGTACSLLENKQRAWVMTTTAMMMMMSYYDANKEGDDEDEVDE